MPDGYDPRAPRAQSFNEARAAFLGGSDTPSDYLERHLAVIAAREGTIKAFCALDIDGARRAAAESTARYRAGKPLSPFDGLPTAIKDNLDVAGLPTAWGIDNRAEMATRDSAVAYALRRGGAIILGKTTAPELGFGQPPATRNPRDEARSPGGSSSGSAAAVAAGFVPMAIGTQGKGSLTRPASFCGVFAFKPGQGTIHRGGCVGGQETNTHIGVLAERLDDAWELARWLAETAGPHPGHKAFGGPMTPPAPVAPKELVRMASAGWDKTDAGARKAFDDLCAHLAQTGIPVVEAADHAPTRELEAGLTDAAHALDVIADFESRWPLFMHLEIERAKPTGDYSDRVVKRGRERDQWSNADYHDALAFRLEWQKKLAAAREDGRFIITPSATGIAPMGTGDTGSSVYQWASSLAGNPCISLPLMAVNGLPLGLEVQGFIGEEELLMAAARALAG